ncbi:hypothetical protein ASE00_07745 [Sphingomonas sp. Root710]|uniref:hypothetical protein n=1 Tax=Sphingomonas sp. Root710 TaxID=1736594 RepID=UPI0007014AD4|nr:hypothetical protein [Sphingomonas sp. Root710]KRB86573.1 hypothetical protein ASE00_07745 [Sphingomonas sp. Root710]
MAMFLAGRAAAQDDSLAKAYAAQCAAGEQTAACKVLRDAIDKQDPPESAAADANSVWIGASLHMYTSRELGKLSDPDRPPARIEFTYPTSPARIAGLLPGDIVMTVAGAPVSLETMAETVRAQPLGKPIDIGILRRGVASILTMTPTSRPDIDTALALARTDKSISRDESARRLYPGRAISAATSEQDAGDSGIWRVACYGIDAPVGSGVRVDLAPYGQRAVLMITNSCTPRSGSFAAEDNGGPRGDLTAITERKSWRLYAQAWLRGSGKNYKIGVTLLSPRELAAWRAQQQQAALAKAQGGDSGLLGGLMMAAGAAMAGGNAQQVMGFGMKGVEMTTDDALTRQAVSGVGDQMVSDGVRTMAMQHAQHAAQAAGPTQGGVAGARAAVAPTQPVVAVAGRTTGVSGTGGIPLRFYYTVALVPGPKSTRNLVCFSEIVSPSASIDPHGQDHYAKVNAAAEPYRSRFLDECSRRGQLFGNPTLVSNVEQGANFDSIHRLRHPEDIYVRID